MSIRVTAIIAAFAVVLAGCADAELDRSQLSPWDALTGEWHAEFEGDDISLFFAVVDADTKRVVFVYGGEVMDDSEIRFVAQDQEAGWVTVAVDDDEADLYLPAGRLSLHFESLESPGWTYVGPRTAPEGA